jgi:hypothetical protein
MLQSTKTLASEELVNPTVEIKTKSEITFKTDIGRTRTGWGMTSSDIKCFR